MGTSISAFLLMLLATTAAAGETIALPKPRTDGAVSVEHALQHRRTVRSFSGDALTLSEIGQLLWAAQGITSIDGLRTAPSAGALYPLELSLVAGNIIGLAPGVYRYQPVGHALVPVVSGDRRRELARAALGQQWIATAPAVIVFGTVEERTTGKYGPRGIGYMNIEVGHAAENIFLQAEALELGAGVVGAFDEQRTAAVLLTPKEVKPLYLMPAGRPSVP